MCKQFIATSILSNLHKLHITELNPSSYILYVNEYLDIWHDIVNIDYILYNIQFIWILKTY